MNDAAPAIRTTTVGSYPVPDWLAAYPSEDHIRDATRVVVDIQRRAGVDLPTDGELYRYDVNHADAGGLIEFFVRPLDGIRCDIGRGDARAFAERRGMAFRARPGGVVEDRLGEGSLDLVRVCRRVTDLVGHNVKMTVTSPYMLARTLLDNFYGDFEALTMALADILAAQVAELDCACLQVDEANVTGNPEDGPLAARAINRLLEAFRGEKAVHFCFGNYGGQTIQSGTWRALVGFLNLLRADHLVLEVAHRPAEDLAALREVDPRIRLGVGVIDVKVNHVETPDQVARRIEAAEQALGPGRVGWVHPDCGFHMLKRSIADRKIAALVAGRDRYLGRS